MMEGFNVFLKCLAVVGVLGGAAIIFFGIQMWRAIP